jgi:hypothetical protein
MLCSVEKQIFNHRKFATKGNTAALVDTLWVSSGKDADLDNNIVINQNTVAIA